jgi:hypothetical protein
METLLDTDRDGFVILAQHCECALPQAPATPGCAE